MRNIDPRVLQAIAIACIGASIGLIAAIVLRHLY